MVVNNFNKYFKGHIYVINLYDKKERWKEVKKQLAQRKIKAQRLITLDGRCQGEKNDCKDKLKTFHLMCNIQVIHNDDILVSAPAASLTCTTFLLLQHAVIEKLPVVLLLEDDVVFGKNADKILGKVMKEIGDYSWDLLYLGSGNRTGFKGVSAERNSDTPHESTINQFISDKFYVKNKLDIRSPCEKPLCKAFSEHVTRPFKAGGTWAYAVSLKGARKIINYTRKNVLGTNHIDGILNEMPNLKRLACDPPIIWHKEGAIRSDSDIPWNDWE